MGINQKQIMVNRDKDLYLVLSLVSKILNRIQFEKFIFFKI